jgi:hypothetical protein
MKPNRLKLSSLTGLALAFLAGLSAARADTTTNLLALTTFDPDGPAGWSYGYFYPDAVVGLGISQADRSYYDPNDVDMTNAMCRYTFDNTAIVDNANNGNYGTGFGAPLNQPNPDPALFVSSNRSDYIFSFDARAEGLKADHTTANLEMQVQIYNSALTPTKILQVNLPFVAGTNSTHFRFVLDEGGFGDNTSDSTFALGYTGVTSLQFNVNSHLPSDAFDFDADNVIIVDNLKLEVVACTTCTNQPQPKIGLTVADWNFDDKPIWYNYEYAWTQQGTQPTMTGNRAAAGYGVGGGNAWILQMDNTVLATDLPQWAGGGTGGEGPIDTSRFDASELSAYRISVDARVEGLAVDRTATTCALQVFVRAPDDTLTPADANTDRDLLVQLNFALTGLSANWQALSYTFDKGSVGGGSKANFTNYFNKIDQIQTQWQIENAASAADWDYDSNNVLVIDNVKVERVYTGCPPLIANVTNDQLVISWAAPNIGTAKLQSATKVDGTYSDVAGATSPYQVPTTGGPKFFRTIWVAPTQ